MVTAIEDREAISGRRLERRDGSAVDCSAVPLHDGATLVTFHDVTDSVNVERALRERNEALVDADKIKIDFVHHVSYELRSPLTNIIGFVHLLDDPATGPLEQKQREYLDYITVSTNTLLALINNILDLATIDAGRMQLNLGEVDIRGTMEGAAEGVQDRLVAAGLTLDIRSSSQIGSFVADERRVRQVLFNLLANAVSFSPPGATVTLLAERNAEAVMFSVTDRGPGIPADVLGKVFDWFESHSLGSQHRGPGIGLSLVRSFVELHGGTVTISSVVGQGTTVTCSFPLGQAAARTAADDLDASHHQRRRKLYRDPAEPAGVGRLRDRHRLCAGARRSSDAVGRSRRRQNHLCPRPDPLSRGRRDSRGAEPDFHVHANLRLPRFSLVHADLYRVTGTADLAELGFDDLPDRAVVLLEWPDRAAGFLPPDRFDISFALAPALGDEGRMARVTGYGTFAARAERIPPIHNFLEESGYAAATRQRMQGDASTRIFERLILDGQTTIFMNAPPKPDGPPVRDGKPYSAIAHLAEDTIPYVAMAKGLRERNLSAPEILHADPIAWLTHYGRPR